MTYISVSTGFKGGGSNPRPFIPSQVVPFGTESLTNYEIGAKSDWFDHSLRFNLDGFYSKYKDIQVTLLSCPQFSGGSTAVPCAAPVNGGDANIYGVEAEGAYKYAGLTIEASGSWQHFEYTSVDPLSGIPNGSTEPGFQPLKWSLGAQYDARIPNGGTVTPRLDFIYASGYQTIAIADAHSYCPATTISMAASPTGRSRQSGRSPWLVRIWPASCWYTQIFDLYAPPQSGADYGIPTPPRTVWAEFKKRF